MRKDIECRWQFQSAMHVRSAPPAVRTKINEKPIRFHRSRDQVLVSHLSSLIYEVITCGQEALIAGFTNTSFFLHVVLVGEGFLYRENIKAESKHQCPRAVLRQKQQRKTCKVS